MREGCVRGLLFQGLSGSESGTFGHLCIILIRKPLWIAPGQCVCHLLCVGVCRGTGVCNMSQGHSSTELTCLLTVVVDKGIEGKIPPSHHTECPSHKHSGETSIGNACIMQYLPGVGKRSEGNSQY